MQNLMTREEARLFRNDVDEFLRRRDDFQAEGVVAFLETIGYNKGTAAIIWESIKTAGIAMVFILFITFFIIYEKFDYHTPSQVPEYKKFPVMVWMNHWLAPIMPTIYCRDGIRCDVYSRLTQPNESISAFLFDGLNFDYKNLPLPRNSNEIWALAYHTPPLTSPELFQEKSLKLFNFSSTFSSFSDLHFFNWFSSVEKLISEVSVEKFMNPVLYLQKDCGSVTERDEYVAKLADHIHIDSRSICFRQTKRDSFENLRGLIRQYKFVVTIDDAVCDGYIDPLVWIALEEGTVPIYFGAPSIRDWLPHEDSAILIEEYPTPKHLSDYLHTLINNDTLYIKHLDHKINMQISNYQLFHVLTTIQPMFTSYKFECFVCKKLHENAENVMTKNQLNCSVKSALTFSEDQMFVKKVDKGVEELYNMVNGQVSARP